MYLLNKKKEPNNKNEWQSKEWKKKLHAFVLKG